MGNETSVVKVGVSGALAMLVIWLLGHYQPELMETAPVGLETAFGALITGVLTYVIPHK